MSDFITLNLSIADASAPSLDLSKTIILGEFEYDDNTDILTASNYFTDTGLVDGTVQRVRQYSSLSAVAVDFRTTSLIYKAASLIFSQERIPSYIYVGQVRAADTDRQSALNSIKAANNGFYMIIDVDADQEEKLDIAAWTESNKKIFIALETSLVANITALKLLDYHRTQVVYNELVDSDGDVVRLDAALAGLCGTFSPGTETQKFLRFNGVTSADDIDLAESLKLSETNQALIKAANGNLYLSSLIGNVFQEGVAVSGRFMDVTRYSDLLSYNIRVALALTLSNNGVGGKTPFTDSGIEKLKHAVSTVLQADLASGKLTKYVVQDDNNYPIVIPYEITLVKAADVSVNDKTNRIYDGITIKCKYSSAIHFVTAGVTITV